MLPFHKVPRHRAYLLSGKPRNGMQNSASTLSWSLVRDIRGWALGPVGGTLSTKAQLTLLRKRYPWIHRDSLRNVLYNLSWQDAAYTPRGAAAAPPPGEKA